jgi:putative heme-binding domain-containing protein
MKTPNPELQISTKPSMLTSKHRLTRTVSLLGFGVWSLFGFWVLDFGISAAELADDPATELAYFQIADGFEVNLFASETNGVVKPIQMRFDARGRLWVIGSTVYPQIEPGQKPNDKVLVLEDTDHDGHVDKTTVFADGLMIPTGIEVVENGCYLGHGTELLFLKDNDGDGKADERRVVLRGFGTGDNHQNINSFMWGEGGELYFCQGLHIHSHVETPWGISSLEKAGLWRLRPRLLKLDGFYGSEHEPQNPWGWVFTDWGEPIVIAGNNSSHIYPVPGLVVDHRDDAPTLIWKDGNGRKCSNGDIVGTTHFPEAWQGALIAGGYINNTVWALKIKDDSAGFALEDLPPLIKSTSRNFRPVDAKFGPDGALYIADWYNPIIGHYQASFRDPNRDKTHGRIWRVTAKGRPLTPVPQLASATIPQLLDYLKSSDRWTRHFAKRVLAEKPTEQVVAALKEWTAQTSLSEHALKEALGVYQSHEFVAAELLAKLCRAKESGARAYAASAIGAWATRLTNALELLRPLAADEHPRVRLQAVVACTYLTNAHAVEAAAVAADFPGDKFLSYALNQAVFALKPYWLPAFRAGRLDLENKTDRIAMLVRADGTSDTVEALRSLLKSLPPDSPARETYWRILADVGDANDLAAMLRIGDVALQARLLPAIGSTTRARNLRPAGNLNTALQPYIEGDDPALRAEALKLAGAWKLQTFRRTAELLVLNASADETSRGAAVEMLGGLGADSDRVLLGRLAATEPSMRVRASAIAALVVIDPGEASSRAADALARLSDTEAIATIFNAFLQRKGGAEALADALAAHPPSVVAAENGLQIVNSSGRRDEQLARVLSAAAGLRAQNSSMNAKEIATFAEEVRTRGDAARGAEVFQRPQLGCMACHAVNGRGGAIGPNLSALGSAQPIDFIVGAILDPQKEIKEGYTSLSVTTRDGEEYQGYQVRETGDELVLRDVLLNKEVRLRRSTIQEKRQNGSVMPSGLADALTRDQFRDLVRYLSELGRTK